MIEIQGLTKRFGEKKAVDAVDLSIPRGQICGYLGPNGAGKTTTVKMLTGILPPDEGSAKIAGFDVVLDSIEVKKRIGMVPESGALFQSLSAREYLLFVGRLYHMEDSIIQEKMENTLDFFELKDKIDTPMSTFSKGMKQKIVIASALIHQPEVLFLDEPLNGLDANTALLIKELIRNLADNGVTVFYCSHILEVVENLCDRVVIIHEGRLVADGSVDQLKEMTRKSSLEGVFSELTIDKDTAALARTFSKSISSRR